MVMILIAISGYIPNSSVRIVTGKGKLKLLTWEGKCCVWHFVCVCVCVCNVLTPRDLAQNQGLKEFKSWARKWIDIFRVPKEKNINLEFFG